MREPKHSGGTVRGVTVAGFYPTLPRAPECQSDRVDHCLAFGPVFDSPRSVLPFVGVITKCLRGVVKRLPKECDLFCRWRYSRFASVALSESDFTLT